MVYWLLKTEPDNYSYFNMEIGDLGLIYHTGKERQIVGVAEIISKPYADPALDDVKRVVVDVQAIRKLPQPVTLANK